MPNETWPLANWACEPTISLYDPPTYTSGEVRRLPPDRAVDKSTLCSTAIRQTHAQVFLFNPE
jgi:hypothetical protein